MLYTAHTFVSKVQKEHLGSPELSKFILSKNIKDRLE